MNLRRCGSVLTIGVVLISSSARGQRVAPLPPPCLVPGVATAPIGVRPQLRPASLVVLPLAVGAGAAPFLYLSDGVPSAIAQRIGSAIPRLYVVGRQAQRRRAADRTAIRTLGSELGVGFVLGGSLGGTRADVRMTFSLYDATTGKKTWTRTFLYDSAGALPIEQSVSVEVASRIVGPATPSELEALLHVPTQRHAAYEAMLRGDVAAVEYAGSLAAEAYRRAVQIDPRFAEAHAKLALIDAEVLDDNDVNSQVEATQLAREVRAATDRAISLDSTSATAWLAVARSWVLEGRPAADWTQAFARAIAHDSTNPAILAAFGNALAQTNERARAHALLERASALDPGKAELWTSLAELAVAEKRDVDACGLLNRAILEDALYAPAWALRAIVRGRHDDLRFAWADAETAERLGSTLLGESAAALIDLTARDTVRARERLTILWQDVRDRKSVSAHEGRAVAVALLAAGDNSRALDVLESVRPLGPRYAASLLDSNFDRLRNEPRFRALVSNKSKS